MISSCTRNLSKKDNKSSSKSTKDRSLPVCSSNQFSKLLNTKLLCQISIRRFNRPALSLLSSNKIPARQPSNRETRLIQQTNQDITITITTITTIIKVKEILKTLEGDITIRTKSSKTEASKTSNKALTIKIEMYPIQEIKEYKAIITKDRHPTSTLSRIEV